MASTQGRSDYDYENDVEHLSLVEAGDTSTGSTRPPRDGILKRMQPRQIGWGSFAVPFLFSLLLNFVLAILFLSCRGISNVATAAFKSPQVSAENSPHRAWIRPDVVYGLVHMAKTAGTEINGELANHYERVCGNKGYSYDALETNERMKNANVTEGQKLTHADVGDAVSKLYPGRNRGRPPGNFQGEIGYDDCDYIAMEGAAKKWETFAQKWHMELHIPCRDPLNHLMSQCNHNLRKFKCDGPNLKRQVKRCVISMNRFQKQLRYNPNITLKCFNPVPPKRYVDFMGTILQRKRIESEYFHRETNKARNKTEECIWKEGFEFQERVRKIMIENYDLYDFCNDCMGSANELSL